MKQGASAVIPDAMAKLRAIIPEYKSKLDAPREPQREDSDLLADVAEILRACADHFMQTLHAAKLLVEEDLCVQAVMLARCVYEAGVRMLWAAREPGNWNDLYLEYCHHMILENRAVIEMASDAERKRSLSAFNASFSKDCPVDERGRKTWPSLNVEAMLHRIRKVDESAGLQDTKSGIRKQEYVLYRGLSGPIHGHYAAIVTPRCTSVDAGLALGGIAMGVLYLLQAVCHYTCPDDLDAVRNMVGRIGAIWRPVLESS